MIISKGLSFAIAVLEQQYGVDSVASIPDDVLAKWRKKHSYFFRDQQEFVFDDEENTSNVDITEDHTEQLSAISIPPLTMNDNARPIVTNKAIYYEALLLLKTTDMTNSDIAKAIHRNKLDTFRAIAKIRSRKYYYCTSDGHQYQCDSLNGLKVLVNKHGWPLNVKTFSNYLSNGGYIRANNGNAYARVFRQVLLKHVTLMDDLGHIFKEM